MTARFNRTFVVGKEHVDELGHINNVVWLQLVIDLAVAHSTAEGMDGPALRALGGTWVVRRHELNYLRPALLGEQVRGETWISEARGAQCVRHTSFRLTSSPAAPGDLGNEHPELLTSSTQWVWVDLEQHRPRRIPAPWLERFRLEG